MKILLTNDDGIRAPGLLALYREMTALGHEVCVAAPGSERSANSHAITWRKPFRVRKIDTGDFHGYEVDGTPADCTAIGLEEFFPAADMVLSGINSGSNIGMDTLYSGTVAAAMEGVLMGRPALAVSAEYVRDLDYAPAAKVAGKVAAFLREKRMPGGLLCNLNVPALPYERMRGIHLAELEDKSLISNFERFDSEFFGSWYFRKMGAWVQETAEEDRPGPTTERALLRQGFATVTFLQWRLSVDAPFAVEGIEL